MNIIVTARHMKLTEAMNENVINSLKQLKHTQNLIQTEVILDYDHKKLMAEITLVGKNLKLNAKTETGNMYEAIDKTVEKLQKQLIKKHELTHNNHKGLHLGEIEAQLVN